MRTALAAHDEVLRSAIEGHGGWSCSSTPVMGCMPLSLRLRSAVDAAVAAQRALELPVRMGIATGEAELRDGDYFGAVLNRAARVMGAGHGGQILLADSTAVLLSGVELVDLGLRRLRDVPMPVGVFQAGAPGLRAEFPPLRALDTSPGQFAACGDQFHRRESEVAEVEAALRGAPIDDVDWGGRGRQDPPGHRSRGAARRWIPGWCLVFRTGCGYRSGVGARRGGRGVRHYSTTRQDRQRVGWPPRWRADSGYWCSTTASTCATPQAISSKRSSRNRRRRKILATSREGLGVADEHLWPRAGSMSSSAQATGS